MSSPTQDKRTPSPTWSAATRYFVLVLVLAAVVWVTAVVGPLLQTVGIAALLALLLNPLVNWLARRTRLPRSWSARLVFTLFLLILLGIPIWIGTLAVSQITELGTDLEAAFTELRQWILQPLDIGGFHLEPANLLDEFTTPLNETLATIPRGSLNLLSNITTNALWTVTVFVTLYYFLKDGHRIKPWLLDHIPPDQRPEIAILWDRTEEIWGKFLRIQLLLFVILSVLFLLGTLLVVWLFRSGLLRWSPLGFILLLLAVYTAVQQVDNLWLRPQYMGRHLQLHPGIVFIGLIAGLAFGGILGALIIVPAIATARIIGRYFYYKILGLPPWAERPTESDAQTQPPAAQQNDDKPASA